MSEPKIDKNGWKYYDKLPDGWRQATIDDFHFQGRRRLGMEFLVRWIDNENYFQVSVVGPDLTREKLMPWIEGGRVMVKVENNRL